VLRQQRAQCLDVLGAPHEAQRQIVEIGFDRERRVLPVLVGDRRRGNVNPWEIHPFV
jgi:hypothetical protein